MALAMMIITLSVAADIMVSFLAESSFLTNNFLIYAVRVRYKNVTVRKKSIVRIKLNSFWSFNTID